MAAITLLHWNVQNFSTRKLQGNNGPALVNYIASVVAHSGANMISLLEVKNSAANNVVTDLVDAINLANGQGPPLPNRWQRLIINSQKNNEAYVLLYQTGHNFNIRTPAAGGVAPISGLTNQRLEMGAPGAAMEFNSSLTRNGGRRPYYATFRTSDTNHNFTIVAYHTMFGYWSRLGVRNVGRLAQCQAVDDGGATIDLHASMTAGDFNVNFNFLDPGDYENLIIMPSAASTVFNTTLVTNTPAAGYPYPWDYRRNAYDNIFRFNTAGLPVLMGDVQDLIDDSSTNGFSNGLFSAQAEVFDPNYIQRGDLIGALPPANYEDSWHIVRHGISDHLPVYVTMNI